MTEKTTSGGAFFLGDFLVSWLSKNKSSISLSIADAEYIVSTSCCTQVIWMKQTLKDLQIKYDHPIMLKCHNTNSINISKNHVMYSKTNHIPIKYYLREQVSLKSVMLEYVDTK